MVNDASPMRDAVETGDGSRAWLFLRRVPEYEAAWRARPPTAAPGVMPGDGWQTG